MPRNGQYPMNLIDLHSNNAQQYHPLFVEKFWHYKFWTNQSKLKLKDWNLGQQIKISHHISPNSIPCNYYIQTSMTITVSSEAY